MCILVCVKRLALWIQPYRPLRSAWAYALGSLTVKRFTRIDSQRLDRDFAISLERADR